jgi:4-methyl-5(b-hydroxyethyl)-thiazole monophosphate biosynthesis
MKTAYIFFADGFEEIEAITPVDCLRRAGVTVTMVGLSGKEVVSAHGVHVSCDAVLSDVRTLALPDFAVLPGGGQGSKNLAASVALKEFISRMFGEGKGVGAICGAPALALGGWEMLEGRSWTCYPGMEGKLPGRHSTKRVLVDGNLITSRAAGTAEEFSLAIVSYLCGDQTAEKIREDILGRS